MRLRGLLSVAAAAMLIAPAAASASVAHEVAPGESLSSIAASDGVSVSELAAANGLSEEASLIAGSTLMIPSPGSGAPTEAGASETATSGEASEAGQASAGSASSSASAAGSYVVQPGDTLSAIAARGGTSVAELAALNGLDPNATLLSGAVLTLPGSSGSEAAAATSQPEGSEAEGSSSAPPYPTAETVTPEEVGAIATENGVPPSLAEAVASEESGFNNEVSSGADARGVMQILPGTWSWIGETYPETPLAPASAASNVRGGVLLLHSLLNATGGDPGLAAAGYYQGLPSVLEEGELPETEQYVSEVLALRHQFGGE